METIAGLALIIALALGGNCEPDAVYASQQVTLRAQKTDQWCWAASGQMVMEFLGAQVTQCDEANRYFGTKNCCKVPPPSQCVNGGWPQFDKYGFTFRTTSNAPLSWEDLKDQIDCQHKPFAFSWHYKGGGGHMMVVIGYAVIAGKNYVEINDPFPLESSRQSGGNHSLITYGSYVAGSDHTHWNDYYDVTK